MIQGLTNVGIMEPGLFNQFDGVQGRDGTLLLLLLPRPRRHPRRHPQLCGHP